ncbi:MAG: asparaginase [Acidimicrobiia bacterium]
MTAPGVELVAITDRSGHDESYHFGAVVALERDGSIGLAVGDPELHLYGRSSNKPMQAVGMVRAGLDLPLDLLALVCASHSGTRTHLDGVCQILHGADLDESSLANTPDYPLDGASMRDIVRDGGTPSRLQMNCSGKHAGMLATAHRRGWPTDASYLEREHPLQQAIDDAIVELTGEPFRHVGVDGCGAPAHVTTLLALARAFRSIATAAERTAEYDVYQAMSTHPFNVGGPRRVVTEFMERIPGLMAKDGAEGVFVAALPDGRAVALKIADGGDRARPVVLAAALASLGIDVGPAADTWRVPTLGHGHPVGRVRPAGVLAAHLPSA